MRTHPLQRRRSSPSWRLYRISLLSALLLSLPILMVVGYYGVRGISAHYRYNLAFGQDEPLTLELFQIHLHDLLTQDLRRLAMPDVPAKSAIPTLNLLLGNGELATLQSNLPPGEGNGEYVNGYLQKGSKSYPIKARYRGRRHWHWSYPQKSWKIRLQTGHFFDGRDTLGLLNTVSPMPFSEQIVLDIAREEGLLTPDYYPIRLNLNGANLGVHFLQTQPDEGLIRASRRIPGGLFSGSKAPIDAATGISSLWQDVAHWKKVATTQTEKLKDFHRLEALLGMVNGGGQAAFATFARNHLDLERFAILDALDVIFGNDQHDFHQDHKFYFDPYRARFEPVAWGVGRWRNPGRLNRTDNPLLLRLKELPEYLTLRNQTVLRLLDGPCHPENIRQRAGTLFRQIRPDQLTDPFWDAYRLLPNVSRYYRQMVRPMDLERQEMVFESTMDRYQRRVDFVRRTIRQAGLSATWQAVGQERWQATLDLTVTGEAGYRLDSVHVHKAPDCTEGAWSIRLDRNLSGRPDTDEPFLVDYRPVLEPGTVQEARPRVHPLRGAVRAVSAPRTYRFFIEGNCVPASINVIATHMVSGEVVRFDVPRGQVAELPAECADRYAMAAGQAARHPWCDPLGLGHLVELGPGHVKINEDREYGPETTVRIAPGTTIKLGKKVTLAFRGKVLAEGTAQDPITFTEGKKRFGGIIVQGAGTQGSRFRHVRFGRGRHAEWGLGLYPGMLNIHDTRDIILDHCQFDLAKGADDVLHIAYVKKLNLEHLTFADCAADALDIEFSSGTLSHVVVKAAGDECLDLMGAKLNVRDSQLLNCGGSAISAGEETRVNVVDTVMAGGRTGLLVKNASRALVDGGLFHSLETAVQVQVDSDRYENRSKLKGQELLVLDCGRGLVTDRPLKRPPIVREPDADEKAFYLSSGGP
jgi:hypothetical protein